MDGWIGRLCALLVVLTLGACGGGPPTPDQKQQGAAAASKTFTYQVPPLVETDAKVTYSATLADGQPLPGWLTLDARTRTFVGIPPDGEPGVMPESLPVQVVATGATGDLAKTTFALRVMQAPGDVPQVINPSEELLAFDPKGLLRWSAVPGADAYEVWVFRDAALKEAHEFSGALTSRQYQLTKLIGGQNYYVKLYFRVNGAWADAPTVPIATAMVVVKPRLTNSQEELDGIHTGGTLRWTTVAGADLYELWVFRDPSLEAFAETSGQLRIPQYQLRTLEAGRTYYAQVYSQINGKFYVGAPLPIRVIGTADRARIVNPQEELDTFATNGQLRWTAVTGAISYEAWIFTNPSSSESYESSGPLTTRSYTTRTLQPSSTYYAQVYALVNGQWQVGSPVKLVTTPTATIARFTNPQEELEGFATNGTLRWTEVPGATRYDVWIYGNAGLGVVAESGTGTNRTYQVEKLCKDATYYAQVYALVNGQWTVGWATRIDVTQGTSPDKCAAPVPDIRLSASATEVTAGQTVTLTWTTKFAASCTASDGWSGASPVSGQTSVGPIQKTTLFTLTCSGSGGVSRAQVLIATVAVVPNVVGLTVGAADAAITSAGFVVGTVTSAASTTVPAGRVISQSPDAGQFVVSGGKVNYVVSTGGLVPVPNVVGLSRQDAVVAITTAGLAVGVTTATSTVPIEHVISQSPPGGQMVAPGSVVNLVISTGDGTPQIRTVPDVVGMTQAEATSAITSAGLTVGIVTTNPSATVPAGRVMSQFPYAGQTVLAGSPVNLVISTGSGPVNRVVPNVIGMTQAAATSAITTAGLTVGTVTSASSATVPAGSVISQNPGAGSLVSAGAAVSIVVSTGPAVGPQPPVAKIERVQIAGIRAVDPVSVPVQFDGSGSYDTDGQVLGYEWSLVSKPPGSYMAVLSSTSGAQVRITPDYPGDYVIRLKVTDGHQYSAPTDYVLAAVKLPLLMRLSTPFVPRNGQDLRCAQPFNELGGPVPDVFGVSVSVTDYPARLEDVTVTASIAGQQRTLSLVWYKCSPTGIEQPFYAGGFSLAGLPTGPYPLTVVATDQAGNRDQLTVTVIHDNPPVLSVIEPTAGSAAIPTLSVDASCSDDYPNCALKVIVDCFPAISYKTVLSGTLTIKGTVDTSLCVHRASPTWSVLVEARDSAGQVVTQHFTFN